MEYQGVKRMIILISLKLKCLKKLSEKYTQQQIELGLLLLIYILFLLAYNDIYNYNEFVITTLFKNTILCIGRTLTRNTSDQQVWDVALQYFVNILFVLDSIHRCYLMSRL